MKISIKTRVNMLTWPRRCGRENKLLACQKWKKWKPLTIGKVSPVKKPWRYNQHKNWKHGSNGPISIKLVKYLNKSCLLRKATACVWFNSKFCKSLGSNIIVCELFERKAKMEPFPICFTRSIIFYENRKRYTNFS